MRRVWGFLIPVLSVVLLQPAASQDAASIKAHLDKAEAGAKAALVDAFANPPQPPHPHHPHIPITPGENPGAPGDPGADQAAVPSLPSPFVDPAPSPPSVQVAMPPDLRAKFFGDWPPTGFCEFELAPEGSANDDWGKHLHFPPAGCNDTTSGLKVPFGLQARVCENDGAGSAGWGKCETFPTGTDSFIGDDLNDRGTSFWVWDDVLYFYFSTNSDEVNSGITVAISAHYTDDGDPIGNASVNIGFDGQQRYYKTYNYDLPAWCAHPDIWQSTRNGDAGYEVTMHGSQLTLYMSVAQRNMFGPNNWIGVGMRCKP